MPGSNQGLKPHGWVTEEGLWGFLAERSLQKAPFASPLPWQHQGGMRAVWGESQQWGEGCGTGQTSL